MARYEVAPELYSFIAGDIHTEIREIPPGRIDVVFVFGFFYHTIRRMELLTEISPQHVILDTALAASESPMILLEFNDPDKEAAAIRALGNQNRVLVGRPNRPALEYFLSSVGFEYEYFDWHQMNPRSWEHIDDYFTNRRATVVAKRNRSDTRSPHQPPLATG